MAGILDKKDRVIDLVLTQEGRRLLSLGQLDFVYFSLFDDEVDYDPWINGSGSLTEQELSASIREQIDHAMILEATTGFMPGPSQIGRETFGVREPLFTMPQGQRILPELEIVPDTSGSVEVIQRKVEEVYIKRDQTGAVLNKIGPVDIGYERVKSSDSVINVNVKDYLDDKSQAGFLVKVFISGSDGLQEIDHKRDFRGDSSYGLDLKIFPDSRIEALERRNVANEEVIKGSVGKKKK